MQSGVSLAFLCLAVSVPLTACESTGYRYGYVNQLNQTVTVVERDHVVERQILAPTAKVPPTPGGSVAERVEFCDARGQQIAVFTLDDYKRSRNSLPPVLVPSRDGVRLASGELWHRLALQWDGGLPSKPVSYGGGDGSSISRAIVVHAADLGDHVSAVYAYMRERFGYMWTYRSMERYLVGTEDSYCDMYEFVTRDGRKHVLYFQGRKNTQAPGDPANREQASDSRLACLPSKLWLRRGLQRARGR